MRTRAFTRLELVVVVAIILALLGVLLPVVLKVRREAGRVSSLGNLFQLALAVANYHDAHGHYPPAYRLGPSGGPAHSWRVLLLPYLSQPELHARYDFGQPWDGPDNEALLAEMPRPLGFYARWHPGQTVTNYLAVVGAETAWPGHTTLTA